MDLSWRLLKNEKQWRKEAKFLPSKDLEDAIMGLTVAMMSHENGDLFAEAGYPMDRVEEFFGSEIAEASRRTDIFEQEWMNREQEEDDQLKEMGLYEERGRDEKGNINDWDFAPDVFMEHKRHNIRNLPEGGHTHETVPAFGNVNIRTPAPTDEYQYGARVGSDMQQYPLFDMEEYEFSPWQTDSEYGNLRNTRQGGFSAQDQMKYTGEPMDLAWRLLKATRQFDYGIINQPHLQDSKAALGEYHPKAEGERRFKIGPTKTGLKRIARRAAHRMPLEEDGYAYRPDTHLDEQESIDRFTRNLAPAMAHEAMHGLDSQFNVPDVQPSVHQREVPAEVMQIAQAEVQNTRAGYPPEPILPRAVQMVRDKYGPEEEGDPRYEFDITDDTIISGEPMDLAWRLLKFQTTLPQFDPTLSEETGYVGVPPVQQYHSATLPDAMKFMTGTQDPHQRMWTEEDPERARYWARGMTQGGPGGAVLGVRGSFPRGDRTPPDWSNQPPTEADALTIPGAELSPQDIVMQRLPLPPPARSMRPRYSDEEIADEQARKKAALQYYLKEIVYNDNISDEEKDAALENISARFDFNEKISDDPSFRYNPTINEWEIEG